MSCDSGPTADIGVRLENCIVPRVNPAKIGWANFIWAGCAVSSSGRARRHAAQFPELSSVPLIGRARVALSGFWGINGVLTLLLSTETDDAQRGGNGHRPHIYMPLPAAWNSVAYHLLYHQGSFLGFNI